jgi:ferrous iron transport protein B
VTSTAAKPLAVPPPDAAAPQPGPQTEPLPVRTLLLAGNPNAGKTTVFNELTGARHHVGNYAGVTVERVSGEARAPYVTPDAAIEIVDLPGTYSLTTLSIEERVAREAILDGTRAGAVVVNVVDGTNLERNLYLTIQLLELGAHVVVALNMADEVRARGDVIDAAALAKELGAPVVPIVGRTGEGMKALMDAALAAFGQSQAAHPVVESHAAHATTDDPMLALGQARYALAARAAQAGVRPKKSASDWLAEQGQRAGAGDADGRDLTDRLDRLALHPLLGVPLFLGLLYLVFATTFTLGEYPMAAIEWLFGQMGDAIGSLWADERSLWRSLIVDGLIGGFGGVVVFMPNILVMYFFMALLESTGYMARGAFLADRLMNRLGLHGKSFVPLMLGFGCNIPAIMATRTLEHRRDRLATILMLPMMSCSARLPIYMLIIPAFFAPVWRAPLLMLIVSAFVLVRLLRSTTLAGDNSPFVMELPPYRLPSLRSVTLYMWTHGREFLRKAGGTIMTISLVLWALMTFPRLEQYEVDHRPDVATLSAGEVEAARAQEDLSASYAGQIGHAIEPALKLIGFDWRLGTAFLGAFAAKEIFVAQMALVFALGKGDGLEEDETKMAGLRRILSREYSPLAAFSVLLFALIATPCMSTVAVVKKETGRWAIAIGQWLGYTAYAYLLCVIVYGVGSRVFA